MREANEELVRHFALSKTESDEAQIVGASIAHLWTILIDSTGERVAAGGRLLRLQVGNLLLSTQC